VSKDKRISNATAVRKKAKSAKIFMTEKCKIVSFFTLLREITKDPKFSTSIY